MWLLNEALLCSAKCACIAVAKPNCGCKLNIKMIEKRLSTMVIIIHDTLQPTFTYNERVQSYGTHSLFDADH